MQKKLVVLAGLVGVVLGCIGDKPNVDHCWYADGDATCRERLGSGTNWHCTTDEDPCGVQALYGCVEERPASDECYSPCGGGQSFLENAVCLAGVAEGGEEGPGDGEGDGDGEGGLASCGDGSVDVGEECDDGNSVDADGCTNACALPACGDGFVQAGEDCDDGGNASGDGCLADCVWAGRMVEQALFEDAAVGLAVTVAGDGGIYVVGEQGPVAVDLTKLGVGLDEDWKISFVTDRPSVSSGDGEIAVIVGGHDIGTGRTIGVKADKGKAWTEDIADNTSVLALASTPGHLVAAGRRDATMGLLARLDPATGGVLETIEGDNVFGPVAVASAGQIWAVAVGETDTLVEYTEANEMGVNAPLELGEYTKLVLADDGGVYVLGHAPDDSSFALFKYSPDGTREWTASREDETASGLALLPNGAPLIAGHTSDGTAAILAWYDPDTGAEIHHFTRQFEDLAVSRFFDVAVAPSGEFAVAVGSTGPDPDDTQLWAYQFEL